MNEANKIDLRSDRRFVLGLGFFGGMLFVSFILYAIQMSLMGSAACFGGLLILAMLYRWLEHGMPRGVNTIASEAAELKDTERKALRDYLSDDN